MTRPLSKEARQQNAESFSLLSQSSAVCGREDCGRVMKMLPRLIVSGEEEEGGKGAGKRNEERRYWL